MSFRPGHCGSLRLENLVITKADFLNGCLTGSWIFHGSYPCTLVSVLEQLEKMAYGKAFIFL